MTKAVGLEHREPSDPPSWAVERWAKNGDKGARFELTHFKAVT